MDYEKLYNDALEKAKGIINYYKEHHRNDEASIEDLEIIFPELKESEDERIRKGIIELVKQSSEILDKQNQNNMIAWLEKQGESYTKKDVDDAYLKGVTNTKNEIEKQYEANYQIRKDIATFIFNYRGDIKDRAKWMDYLGIKVSFVEKQGENKSTWSEGDERIVTALMEGFRYHQLFNPRFGEVPNAEIISWIKSLKERLS